MRKFVVVLNSDVFTYPLPTVRRRDVAAGENVTTL